MKSVQHFKKVNTIEMCFYELVGIKQFRRTILIFERIKYWKKGTANVNYHPEDTSESTLSRFSGYLIYNSIFHIVSLILTAVYFFATRSLSLINIVTDGVMVALTIFNFYCLMLQRYTYLSFAKHICKKQVSRNKIKSKRIPVITAMLESKSDDEIKKEIALLRDIRQQILSGEDVVLTSDSYCALQSIALIVGGNEKTKTATQNDFEDCTTVSELVSIIPHSTRVVSPVQYRVSYLQKILRFNKKDNVLFGFCVVTDGVETEAAYRKIFPYSCTDDILNTIELLLDAYEMHLQKEVLM